LKIILFFVKHFEEKSVIHKMKKVISIALSFIMLIALLHLSVATHYCGGEIADSKISFSGKLASCGMEENENNLPQTDLQLSTHCCDNVVAFYGINSTHFPSFSSLLTSYQNNITEFSIPLSVTINSHVALNSIYTSVSPPSTAASNEVDLAGICMFRI
jgi:uncharacterized protein (UPF0333 family)